MYTSHCFLHVEKQVVVTNKIYVMQNNQPAATVDDVLNALTMLLCSERSTVNLSKYLNAARYLVALGVVQEVTPGEFTMLNRNACLEISNNLSNYVDQLLSSCNI